MRLASPINRSTWVCTDKGHSTATAGVTPEASDKFGEKSGKAEAEAEVEVLLAFVLVLVLVALEFGFLVKGLKSRPVSLADTRLITEMAPEFKASGLAKLSSSKKGLNRLLLLFSSQLHAYPND